MQTGVLQILKGAVGAGQVSSGCTALFSIFRLTFLNLVSDTF